jgi:hypothetical protein
MGATRRAGVMAALVAAAAASLVGFAGAAHATSGSSVPNANHELGIAWKAAGGEGPYPGDNPGRGGYNNISYLGGPY